MEAGCGARSFCWRWSADKNRRREPVDERARIRHPTAYAVGSCKSPRRPVRPQEHPVRVAVADDFLRRRVPANRPADADSNVTQVTDRRRSMPDLDVADRLLTRLDAGEPVVPVLRADL